MFIDGHLLQLIIFFYSFSIVSSYIAAWTCVDMLDTEFVPLIRSMRGAPSSILLVLLFSGRSITNKDLQLITGYTDKPIASALALLESYGYAQNNGRYSGWSFPLTRQLPLFMRPSIEPVGRPPGYSAHFISASSPADVESWLLRAGVSPNSVKLSELLSLELDLDLVKSWVLEFEWWLRERRSSSSVFIAGRRTFTVGTLIRILQDGDKAPPMRCSDCLAVLPCYCDIVSR